MSSGVPRLRSPGLCRRIAFVAVVAAQFVSSCGEVEGPKGPSGGANRFRVVFGGQRLSFEVVSLSIKQGREGSVVLALRGVDYGPEGVTDAFAFVGQRIEVNLQGLTAPAELSIDLLTFHENIATSLWPRETFFGEKNDPAIVSARTAVVFLGGGVRPLEAQRTVGVLRLSELSKEEISGELATGVVVLPSEDTPRQDTIDTWAEFNLSRAN